VLTGKSGLRFLCNGVGNERIEEHGEEGYGERGNEILGPGEKSGETEYEGFKKSEGESGLGLEIQRYTRP